MSRLLSPNLVIVLAVLFGVAAGAGSLWKEETRIAAQVLAARKTVVGRVTAERATQRAHGWDFWTVEMDNLTTELRDEKARARQQREALEQRESRLKSERVELDKLRAGLEEMRREIDDRVITIRADESKNLGKLAQTYSTLTPDGAVAILREMDDVTVVKILSLMKPDVVGPIFEIMSKTEGANGTMAKRVAALSEKLRMMKSAVAPAS